MSRAGRLFRVLHLLRTLPAPVTAARLAEAEGLSPRSVYRDVAALRAAGARIEGEAGYGYTLAEDPALPPQSFTRLEIEALVLGLAEVGQTAGPELARAAEDALAKIVATLPDRLQRQAAHAVLQVYRGSRPPAPPESLEVIRAACWDERALDIGYRDAEGRETERRIWPLSIVFLDASQMLLAWCCLRQARRRFVLQRVLWVRPTDESFRPRRVPLLREFAAEMRG